MAHHDLLPGPPRALHPVPPEPAAGRAQAAVAELEGSLVEGPPTPWPTKRDELDGPQAALMLKRLRTFLNELEQKSREDDAKRLAS